MQIFFWDQPSECTKLSVLLNGSEKFFSFKNWLFEQSIRTFFSKIFGVGPGDWGRSLQFPLLTLRTIYVIE